jgi:hypothetical protein
MALLNFEWLSRVCVDGGEVEFSGDEEEDCFHGLQASVSARLSFGGLVIASMKPLVWRDLVQATMPSKWVRIMVATCFMGSTLERMTLVHHRASMAETMLNLNP